MDMYDNTEPYVIPNIGGTFRAHGGFARWRRKGEEKKSDIRKRRKRERQARKHARRMRRR